MARNTRPMFLIYVNHPVGDLSRKTYEKWSSYSKAVNLLHSCLNLIKQDVAAGSQWKKYCWKKQGSQIIFCEVIFHQSDKRNLR